MTTQPEQLLENNLVSQLRELGYPQVEIKDESDLLRNLQLQLENHNKTKFTQNEFFQILNQLGKGNIFEKAKTLREKIPITNDKGQVRHIELINKTHWCQNLFQVTQQVTMEGSFKNRYDVTILINGLPLVQIELKRRGLELKEAFNQTNRYERHSYGSGAGLFQFIQIFIISNGVNTKYYYNEAYTDKAGICTCPRFCTGQGDGTAIGSCKKITIAAFQTGSIIITGARNRAQLDEAYGFMNRVLTTHRDLVTKVPAA